MPEFRTIDLEGVQLHYAEAPGPEPVRARAIQLHQLDPTVLEPLLAGTLLNGAEPDKLCYHRECRSRPPSGPTPAFVQALKRFIMML